MVRSVPTIRDVAELANVSTTTASDALAGSPRVHPDTAELVTAAAQELNYRANPRGAQFRDSAVLDVGLLVPNQSQETMTTGSGSLWARTVLGFTQAFNRHNLRLVVVDPATVDRREKVPVSAFIALDSRDQEFWLPSLPFGAPLYITDPRSDYPYAPTAAINYDYPAVARDAITYLIEQAPGLTQIELWRRDSEDTPPLTESVTRAIADECRVRGYTLTIKQLAPDARVLESETYRLLGEPEAGLLLWGLDPAPSWKLICESKPAPVVLPFGDGTTETGLNPPMPYLTFQVEAAAGKIAAEVARCLSECLPPEPVLLEHHLVIP